MSERSFKMGDVIQVDTVVGTVVSIDLLAVRSKTAENQLVRIPNETIIKTNFKNITHYPLRRFTLNVSVSLAIAEKNAFAVKDPAPVIIFDSLSASSIDILFGVWSSTKYFLSLMNSILIEVVNRFREESITIPFPELEINSR
ncbi:MAG TPA: mechanosensitive ion channel domain-containing protein [Treponemataceae bacterium]|nr:mechanosensitive ion channel domain-containing protein [Treponemataceae bacterium]